KTAEFVVTALQSGQRRQLILLHEGKRLAGSVVIQGDEKGPLAVKLQPWGTVSGRLVDTDGRSRRRALDTLERMFGSGVEDLTTVGSLPTRSFSTDQDGRFRIEGLVPGLKYNLSVVNGNMV